MIDRAKPLFALLFCCLLFGACEAQKIVFVGSDDADEVATFQLDGTVEGTATIPNVQSTNRALIVPGSGANGYVSGASGTLHSVDLTSSPPALDSGVANLSHDISDIAEATPILLVTAGRETGGIDAMVSSVLTGPMREADVLNFGPAGNTGTIDVCENQSTVLVAFTGGGQVRKLTVGPQGSLTDTRASYKPTISPSEIECAPGNQTGIVIGSSSGPAQAQSFTISNMRPVETVDLAAGPSDEEPLAHSIELDSTGKTAFVLSSVGGPPVNQGGTGFVERISYDPSTGTFGSRT